MNRISRSTPRPAAAATSSAADVIQPFTDYGLFAWLGAEQARLILRAASDDPEVKKLFLTKNVERLSDSAWDRLGRILRSNTHLQELDITHYGGLVDANASGLFERWQSSRTIHTLCLNGINLRDSTRKMASVASFLSNSPVLRDLRIPSCNIGDIDLDELVLALRKSKTLTYLDLDGNDIGHRGCTSLAKLLADKESTLKALALGKNSIDDESAKILAESLSENKRLVWIFLQDNQGISRNGWASLLKL